MNRPQEKDTGRETRSLIVEREVDAPPEVVWRTLTDPEELGRWFPLEARVEPGVGGTVWLSWGPGCEGEAPIRAWDPPHRIGWTESYGQDAEGRPIEVKVDLEVEGREGRTVVRVVQSGLSAGSDWDEMYDALKDGWTYFLFNLSFYLARHRGTPRIMVWKRVPSPGTREAEWARFVEGGLLAAPEGTATGSPFELRFCADVHGTVVSARDGHHFAGVTEDLGGALLFVELEGANVGVWLSTYGLPEDQARSLQNALDERLAELEG